MESTILSTRACRKGSWHIGLFRPQWEASEQPLSMLWRPQPLTESFQTDVHSSVTTTGPPTRRSSQRGAEAKIDQNGNSNFFSQSGPGHGLVFQLTYRKVALVSYCSSKFLYHHSLMLAALLLFLCFTNFEVLWCLTWIFKVSFGEHLICSASTYMGKLVKWLWV